MLNFSCFKNPQFIHFAVACETGARGEVLLWAVGEGPHFKGEPIIPALQLQYEKG